MPVWHPWNGDGGKIYFYPLKDSLFRTERLNGLKSTPQEVLAPYKPIFSLSRHVTLRHFK